MSGMRRFDGNQTSKSKYAQKKNEEEEEIDFAQEDLFEETEKFENSNKNKNVKIVEENVNSQNNHFEKLNVEENINNLLVNVEGKNEEEIKINQNELVNAMKELEEATNSSRDDSQISVNEGKLKKGLYFLKILIIKSYFILFIGKKKNKCFLWNK